MKQSSSPATPASAVNTDAVSPRPGLRERKKAEKLHQIKQSARELFYDKGYEATTMREIAAHADVGFGTISAYATDKAGLLAMLFVDDLEMLPPLFETIDPQKHLLDQLVDAFMKLYNFWSQCPPLSRIVLPQMEFYNTNPYTDIILQRRRQLQRTLTQWLDQWQSQGLLVATLNTEQLSRTFFSIYTSALREWVAQDELDLAEGRNQLRYLLEIPASLIETTGL
jgi:AcrR family transcriptional regulator